MLLRLMRQRGHPRRRALHRGQAQHRYVPQYTVAATLPSVRHDALQVLVMTQRLQRRDERIGQRAECAEERGKVLPQREVHHLHVRLRE